MSSMSLPLRECGLKSCRYCTGRLGTASLPLRECGLKFIWTVQNADGRVVTPLAGVWIEMRAIQIIAKLLASLPLRECGLKYGYYLNMRHSDGHSPCGSVD